MFVVCFCRTSGGQLGRNNCVSGVSSEEGGVMGWEEREPGLGLNVLVQLSAHCLSPWASGYCEVEVFCLL